VCGLRRNLELRDHHFLAHCIRSFEASPKVREISGIDEPSL
jgi:hypothetical protein